MHRRGRRHPINISHALDPSDKLTDTPTARLKAGPVPVLAPPGLTCGAPWAMRRSLVRGREDPPIAMLRAPALCVDLAGGVEGGRQMLFHGESRV